MDYDVAIIGGGPAGVTAGVYSVRYNLKTILVSPLIGGWIGKIPYIENWPGEPEAVNGYVLAERFHKQLVNIGTNILESEAVDISKEKAGFVIKTSCGQTIKARAVILAMGLKKPKLEVPGEDEFQGKGVSYCVTCDGPLFKGKRVIVAGSGDSAIISAIMLAEYAEKVYISVKGPELAGKPYRIEQIKANPKIEVHYNTTVQSIFGNKYMGGVVLNNGTKIKAEGLFVDIGLIPLTDLAVKLGIKLESGLIAVKGDMSTNIPGAFAAGNITNGSNGLNQIITAAAEGAIAANSIYNFLR